MSLITEKTRLPLSLVITLVVALCSLAGLAAVAQYRIGDTATNLEKVEEKAARSERKTQRLEDMMGDIRDTLKEIKDDVKELRREAR